MFCFVFGVHCFSSAVLLNKIKLYNVIKKYTKNKKIKTHNQKNNNN